MPMTKPVVADTKVTDPGSNPLGTVVPAGGVTLGAVEVGNVVVVMVVVVDRDVVRELVQAPVATARPSTTTDSAFEGFLTEPPWTNVAPTGRDRSHNRLPKTAGVQDAQGKPVSGEPGLGDITRSRVGDPPSARTESE